LVRPWIGDGLGARLKACGGTWIAMEVEMPTARWLMITVKSESPPEEPNTSSRGVGSTKEEEKGYITPFHEGSGALHNRTYASILSGRRLEALSNVSKKFAQATLERTRGTEVALELWSRIIIAPCSVD